MKRKFYFLSILPLFLSIKLCAQAPVFQWAKNAGGADSEEPQSIATDIYGNVYVAGYFQSSTLTIGNFTLTNAGSSSYSDILIAKYDSTGTVLWAKRAGGINNDAANSIFVDTSGNVYVTGYFQSASISFANYTLTRAGTTINSDIFIVRLDANGNVQWAKSAGGISEDGGNSIIVGPDGAICITGYFSGNSVVFGNSVLSSVGNADILVAKYDPDGNALWAKSGGGTLAEHGKSICSDADGHLFITGYFTSASISFEGNALPNAGSGKDFFLTKYNSAGNVVWVRRAGNTGSDAGYGVATDTLGNVYATGFFGNYISLGSYMLTTAGFSDFFLVKYDPSGNVLWAKRGGGNSNEESRSIFIRKMNIYIAGYFGSNSISFDGNTLTNTGNTDDVFVAKYDENGNSLWAKSAGGSSSDRGYGVTVDFSEKVYVTGSFYSSALQFGGSTLANSTSSSYSDIFTAKYVDIDLCHGSLSSSDSYISASADTSNFYLVADSSCNWSAVSQVPWITLLADSGTGSDTVLFAVTANPSSNSRTGTILIAGLAYTIVQEGISCSFSFSSSSQSFSSSSSAGKVGVNTQPGCEWQATTGNSWITFYQESGTGTDTIFFSVQQNIYTYSRTGTITLEGQTFTIIQEGVPCSPEYPDCQWVKSHGGGTTMNDWDDGNSLVNDAAGNTYVAGFFTSDSITFGNYTLMNSGNNTRDLYFVKYDPDGNVLWAKRAGGSKDDNATGVAADAAGNVYFTGNFESPAISFDNYTLNRTSGSTMPDAFVIKCDPDGNVQWAKKAEGSGYDVGQNIAADSVGNIYVIGSFASSSISFGSYTLLHTGNSNTTDIFLTKYDTDGNVLWAKNAAGNGSDVGKNIALDGDGNAFITGQFSGSSLSLENYTLTNSDSGKADFFVAKYDPNGNVLWAKSGGGYGFEASEDITVDPSGNILITGSFYSSFFSLGNYSLSNTYDGDADIFLIKYDNTGNVLWAKGMGGVSGDISYGITTDMNGNIYVTGVFGSSVFLLGNITLTRPADISLDMFLAKFDSAGTPLWAKNAGGTAQFITAYGVSADANGNLFVVGSFTGASVFFCCHTLTGSGGNAIYIIKYGGGTPPCQYTLSSFFQTISSSGGTGSFEILTDTNCAWTALSSDSWISITSDTTGTGNGTIYFSVAANENSFQRTGYITVEGVIYTIHQEKLVTHCIDSIYPASQAFPYEGGSDSIVVVAADTCPWAVSQTPAWININAGFGYGNGTVHYSVQLNPGLQRSGTLIIDGQTIFISQSANPNPPPPPSNDECANSISLISYNSCHYDSGTTVGATQSLPPIECNFSTGDADDDVWYSFTAVASNHSIEVHGIAGFDAILDLRSGSCTGVNIACADFSFGSDPEILNATGLTIGATYFVRVYDFYTGEANFLICLTHPPCINAISSTSQSFAYPGGTGAVTVSAPTGCVWTVTSNDNWITLTSPVSNSGGGTVTYTVAANTSSFQRTGTITIGTQTYSVIQNGDTTPPPNDECAGAVSLTSDTVCNYITGSTITATQSIPENTCLGGWGYDVDKDVWYSFTAVAHNYTINVQGMSGFDAVVDLRSGGCNGTNIACADASMSNELESLHLMDLTIGTTYYLRIYNYYPGGGDFQLCVTHSFCDYSIDTVSQSFASQGGTGQVSVGATTGCSWTAVSSDSWINIPADTMGTGNGIVNYSVDANTAAYQRSGYIVVEDHYFNIIQEGTSPPPGNDECANAVSITPSTVCNYLSGSTAGATESLPPGCGNNSGIADDVWYSFTASSENCTIKVEGLLGFKPVIELHSGSCGGVSIGCSVGVFGFGTINASGLTIGSVYFVRVYGNDFEEGDFKLCITRPPCMYNLSATSQWFSAAADTGSVSVSTAPGCVWSAVSNNSWITITSGSSGAGNGTVGYSISANTGSSQRDGTITVAGKTYTVHQGEECIYTVWPSSGAFTSSAASGSVNVSCPANCPRTAVSNDAWISITSGGNGTGGGVVNYSLTSNTSASQRIGTIAIEGAVHTVIQDGAGLSCAYSLSASSQTFTSGPATGAVQVISPAGCSWTAASNNSWINITSGTYGSGNGTVSYSVTANGAASQRSGTMIIAGETYTVIQYGVNAACIYAISPSAQSYASSASTGAVGVVAATGCNWTVTSNNSWINILSGSSGNGNGTVTYVIEANTNSLQRTGTVTVGGETHMITQSGISCSYENPSCAWSTAAGGPSGEVAAEIVVDAQQNAYVIGSFESSSITFGSYILVNTDSGSGDIFLVKYDSLGNVIWAKSAGGNDRDGASGISLDHLGNLYVSGDFKSSSIVFDTAVLLNNGGGDFFLAKYDTAGNVLWVKSAGSAGLEHGNDVSSDGNGNAICTGTFDGSSLVLGNYTVSGSNFTNSFLVKYDPAGNIIWAKGGSGILLDVLTDNSGNTYSTGTEVLLAKWDSAGNKLWEKNAQPGGNLNSQGVEISMDIFGNIYVTGSFSSQFFIIGNDTLNNRGDGTIILGTDTLTGFWELDIFLVKYDTGGNMQWAKSAGGPDAESGNGISVDNEGHIYITGFCASPSLDFGNNVTTESGAGTPLGTYLAKYDSAGNPVWVKTAGGSIHDNAFGLETDSDGNIYVVGAYINPVISFCCDTLTNEGDDDAYIVKYSGESTGCQYSLDSFFQTFSFSGGTGSIGITADSNCIWTAVADNGWISITSGSSGSGAGTVTYSVAANPNAFQRSGTITVAGQVYWVVQEGLSCTYSLAMSSQSFSSSPNTGAIVLTTGANCTWTAVSNDVWITIISGSSGAGNATLTYSVNENTTSSQRTGSITIAGMIYIIQQEEADASCPFTISASPPPFSPSENTEYISVTTNTGCIWTAVSNADWIDITDGSSGSGSGTITYSISANTGDSQRVGTINIAGLIYTVIQDGTGMTCMYAIFPAFMSFAAAGGMDSISITADTACFWTAFPSHPWITITSADNGTGSGTVHYSVAANTSVLPRTGTITIAGQAFTIDQAESISAPFNDDYINAIILTSDTIGVADSCNYVSGTSMDAAQSLPAIVCNNNSGIADDDVWYRFNAVSSGHSIKVQGLSGFDAVIDLRSGADSGSTVGCADSTASNGLEVLSASALMPDSSYLIRVYNYNPGGGNFNICITHTTPDVKTAEIKEIQELIIYPNPSGGTFTIKAENLTEEGKVRINIKNMLGQAVFASVESIPQGRIFKTIDLSHIARGIYCVEFLLDKSILKKRVVIE